MMIYSRETDGSARNSVVFRMLIACFSDAGCSVGKFHAISEVSVEMSAHVSPYFVCITETGTMVK